MKLAGLTKACKFYVEE
ncbi:unnamed protein product, partial [Vitis vinifera]|uniref:Uncharacterized protein n=1 Tax=Vitis vinifera TaxID=29760 RepID=D7SRZ8_VITVI